MCYASAVVLLENVLFITRYVDRQSRQDFNNNLPWERKRRHLPPPVHHLINAHRPAATAFPATTSAFSVNAKSSQNFHLIVKKWNAVQIDTNFINRQQSSQIQGHLNSSRIQGHLLAKATENEFYRKRLEKVNPYLYDIVLKPTIPCRNDTFVVILVHSHHFNTMQRSAIRNTWGSVAALGGNGSWPNIARSKVERFRLVFVLGSHANRALNDIARREASRFDDVVQGNFRDSYQNMTLKSLLGLKFVSEYCTSAKYLLKSDDDMFINLPYLLKILTDGVIPRRAIIGPLNVGSVVMRIGKWKLTKEEFPFSFFPPYESGAAYVISCDIVRELYETAEYVPHIFIDDVYITGILGRILNVTHYRRKGFAHWSSPIPTVCDVVKNRIISATRMTPFHLESIWLLLMETPVC